MAVTFTTGDTVKSKNTGIEYVVVRATDRGYHGINQFYECKPVKGGYIQNFPLKELEKA